ncbi:hypothetical protein Tco_0298171, partial [Tanacetum coccineum]
QRDQEVIGDDEETLIAVVAFATGKTHQETGECVCEECLHNRKHITYDVCFCKGCLEEEENLKYEPLNDQKRYDSTQSTIPIEEVAATGWGEEFKDEDTPTTKFMVREQETTDSSESEWENPFTVKSGGNQESCFHLKEDEELPYPRF